MKNEPLWVIGITICMVAAAVFSFSNHKLLSSGKHLASVKPQIILSADCPWAALPPAIKEYISLNATTITKLNKEDMLQLSEWYKEQAKVYKEPKALINLKGFPQPKGAPSKK